jgi:N-acetylneuraminic acid mutarotase
MVGGVPVVVGGSSWPEDPQTRKKKKQWRNECFVFRDGKWLAGPSLSQPLSDPAYASGPNGLYIAGGTHGHEQTSSVQYLADTTNGASWRSLQPLPEPVEGAAGAIADSKFYVFGGFSGNKISNHLCSLDLSAVDAQWKNLAPLPAPGRAFSALVAAHSGLYLFGGIAYPPYKRTTEIYADVYRYDPAADQWSQVQGLHLPGYGWTASAVSKRQIMLTGRVSALDKVSDEILLVNLDTLDVKPVGRMVTPACCMPAIQINSKTWLLPGGEPSATAIRTARTTVVQLEVGQTR